MGVGKLFIFVLFETVVQISFANHQSAICLLQSSERDNSEALAEIGKTIFAVINYEAKFSLGIEKEIDNPAEVIELVKQKLTLEWSKALYATLFAIEAIGSDPPVDFVADLSAEEAKLAEIGECIFRAIEYSRQHGGTLEQIERTAAQATAILIEIFKTIFDAIRNRNGHQSAVTKAIHAVEAKALATVRGSLAAIFDAIKVLYEIHASKIPVQAKDILATIDLLGSFALSIAKDEVDNKYDLFRAIVISVAANSPQIGLQFTLIQTAEQKLVAGWNETFSCLTDLLSTIYECEDIDLATEAIEDQTVEGLTSAYFAFIDAIEVLRDEDSPSIIIDESALQEQLEKIVELIFESTKISLSDGASEKLAEIQSNEDQVVYAISDLGSDLFEKVALVTIDRVDLDVQIKQVQKLASGNVEKAFRAVFGLIKFIAENQNSNDEYLADRYALVIAGTKLVVAYELKQEVALKFQLIRALDIRNSLYPLSATDPLDYCVDIA